MYYGDSLVKMDSKYFSDEDYTGQKFTLEKLAYKLATYLFDGNDRRKIKTVFSNEVYIKTLENFIDENHDT